MVLLKISFYGHSDINRKAYYIIKKHSYIANLSTYITNYCIPIPNYYNNNQTNIGSCKSEMYLVHSVNIKNIKIKIMKNLDFSMVKNLNYKLLFGMIVQQNQRKIQIFYMKIVTNHHNLTQTDSDKEQNNE